MDEKSRYAANKSKKIQNIFIEPKLRSSAGLTGSSEIRSCPKQKKPSYLNIAYPFAFNETEQVSLFSKISCMVFGSFTIVSSSEKLIRKR